MKRFFNKIRNFKKKYEWKSMGFGQLDLKCDERTFSIFRDRTPRSRLYYLSVSSSELDEVFLCENLSIEILKKKAEDICQIIKE